MLAAGGGKKDAPAAKPTLEQVKDSVKIDASSKYVVPRFLYTEMGIDWPPRVFPSGFIV